MADEYNLDDVLPGNKKSKHSDILERLNEIEDIDANQYQNKLQKMPQVNDTEPTTTSSFLPSSMLKEKKKKKSEEYDPDAWFNEMMAVRSTKINKKGGYNHYSYFDENGIIPKKKKKKKDKEKSDKIDFNKEFEPELALYRNLLIDQSRFTEDLQKEYDSITSVKSSSRGITKQMTDLIENINGARTLSMQLVEKNVNAKKLIAELTMKQKKELGESLDGENMADFAANYLKNMLNERQLILNGTGDNTVSEYSDDEMFDILSDTLNNSEDGSGYERSAETDIYLKYENRNVEVFVVITDNDIDNYEFEARDEDGEYLDDYPMPNHTKISVNRSTNIATDAYGKKYNIIWR